MVWEQKHCTSPWLTWLLVLAESHVNPKLCYKQVMWNQLIIIKIIKTEGISVSYYMLSEKWESLKIRVSEIRIKWICVNQGVGVIFVKYI